MKFIKIIFIALLCCTVTFPLFSESNLNNSFKNFGIQTIGIYTQAYEDLRSSNFLTEYLVMQNNPILSDPSFYKDQYCNFNLTTQPLTTPGYPLDGRVTDSADATLNKEIKEYLSQLGWKTKPITDFQTGSLTELLAKAAANDIDAALIVRYTPVTEFIPVEGYREDFWSGASGITTGNIKFGLAYYPTLELYDTASGTRLWYSAYYSGHQIITKQKPFVENVAAAEQFFVEVDTSSEEALSSWASAELTGEFDSIWSKYNVDELAAQRMIELAMQDIETPFPKAADSGQRNNPPANAQKLRHMFWTDYPSYALMGTSLSIGYTLDYIGNYKIYYKDTVYDDTPVEEAGIIAQTMMHKAVLPLYSISTANLAIEPAFYFGMTIPASADLSYTNITTDYDNGGYMNIAETDTATASFSSFGLEIALKYYLRFTDTFSFYIGGSGTVSSWWEKLEGEDTDYDEFAEGYKGLYVNYDADLIINASAIAGVRFDSERPFEIFAMYTPIGPGGGMMLSAGLRWIPFTWGWTQPHQTHLDANPYY